MTIAFDINNEDGLLSPFLEAELTGFLIQLARDTPACSYIIYGKKRADGDLPSNWTASEHPSPGDGSWLKRLFTKPAHGTTLLFKVFRPGGRISHADHLLITDLSPLVHPEHFTNSENKRFRIKIESAIATAKSLVVFSPYYRSFLLSRFNMPEERLHYWQLSSPVRQEDPGWEEKEKLKAQFTGGAEYFLFAGDLHPRHELVTLLKAFSDFKKWQRTGMKLVLAGYDRNGSQELENLLSTYKYRTDVLLIKNPTYDKLQQLMSAAYCLVYPAVYDPFPAVIDYALAAKLPVITTDIPEVKSLAGDRVVYVEASAAALSQHMQLIYKDEGWRAELISKASAGLAYHSHQVPGVIKQLADFFKT